MSAIPEYEYYFYYAHRAGEIFGTIVVREIKDGAMIYDYSWQGNNLTIKFLRTVSFKNDAEVAEYKRDVKFWCENYKHSCSPQ